MKQIITSFAVDASRLGAWLELNGGELVGCDSNIRKGEFMFVVRPGEISMDAIVDKVWSFHK